MANSSGVEAVVRTAVRGMLMRVVGSEGSRAWVALPGSDEAGTAPGMTRFTADLLLLSAAAVWGFAFIAQKTAMSHLDPLVFVAFRGAIASLCLLPLAVLEHRRAGGAGAVGPAAVGAAHECGGMARRLLRLGGLAGALFFTGAWLQQAGIVTASVTNTSFLTVLYTVFTPLLAWAALARPPPVVVWPAVACSFAGTWLLSGGSLAPFGIGELLVIGSALFWASHMVATGAAPGLGRPFAFNALQFAVVSILGFALAFAQGPSIDLAAVWAASGELFFVGVLSSAVTFTMLTVAMRHTPPGEAAILVSTETVFAAAAAYWVLGERLSPLGWIGAGLILGAALLVQAGPTFEARLARNRAPSAGKARG